MKSEKKKSWKKKIAGGVIGVLALLWLIGTLGEDTPSTSSTAKPAKVAEATTETETEAATEPITEPIIEAVSEPVTSETVAVTTTADVAKVSIDTDKLREQLFECVDTDASKRKYRAIASEYAEEDVIPVYLELLAEKVESPKDQYWQIYSKGIAETWHKRYRKIYSKSPYTDQFQAYFDKMDELAWAIHDIGDSYPYDITEINNIFTGTTYIWNKIPKVYPDALDGMIQKEIDYWKDDKGSNWYATDDILSDTAYVIHVAGDVPFTNAGFYEVAVYDTGETTTLVDSKGFQNEYPIYQLITNYTQLMNDFERIDVIRNEMVETTTAFKISLGIEPEAETNSNNANDMEPTIDPSIVLHSVYENYESSGDAFYIVPEMDSYILYWESAAGIFTGNCELCEAYPEENIDLYMLFKDNKGTSVEVYWTDDNADYAYLSDGMEEYGYYFSYDLAQ